jgi:D-galactarolactone isomerase
LETERLVVVQPTTYGLDNSCQLEAMATFGTDARGVAVVDAATPREELARLTDLGVRGARFHMLAGGAVGWEVLEVVAARVAPFGWHIQLQLNGRDLVDHVDRLLRLPVGLVVDHIGRFMPPVETDSAAFAALLTLVDHGAMVKLSAPYESSTVGPPDFDDVTRLADTLVARAADRLLWASNWPHPGQPSAPSALELVALRDRWLPTDEVRQLVLVDNPAELYDF